MNTVDKGTFNPKMQGQISVWLTKHKFSHRPLGYDYRGVEILQAKLDEWLSIAFPLYTYGFNYLLLQCAYDAAPRGCLISVYHLTQMRDQQDQPEEICAKVWKSANSQERESYDMLGITYWGHPYLRHTLMPKSWIGWPLRKDYVVPNFYALQDAY
ncbi:hypothetical protein KP509_10G060800 [Ceratopteris richardii]|uniref:NADH:ubiquinone oxidoreductase 30kDa subunit domain-containing protein n=1 Tax=Ceratopteris richardii TaxID=49495 RepID=A0A8T2U1M4_CERRI|nr:hypothetical protein KP509_10G060800 [Ceratopteris richardii]